MHQRQVAPNVYVLDELGRSNTLTRRRLPAAPESVAAEIRLQGAAHRQFWRRGTEITSLYTMATLVFSPGIQLVACDFLRVPKCRWPFRAMEPA